MWGAPKLIDYQNSLHGGRTGYNATYCEINPLEEEEIMLDRI